MEQSLRHAIDCKPHFLTVCSQGIRSRYDCIYLQSEPCFVRIWWLTCCAHVLGHSMLSSAESCCHASWIHYFTMQCHAGAGSKLARSQNQWKKRLCPSSCTNEANGLMCWMTVDPLADVLCDWLVFVLLCGSGALCPGLCPDSWNARNGWAALASQISQHSVCFAVMFDLKFQWVHYA